MNTLPTHETLMGVFDNHWSDAAWKEIEAQQTASGFSLSKSVWNIAEDAQTKALAIIKDAEQNGKTFGKVKDDLAALLSEKGKANMGYNIKRLWVDQLKTDRIIAQRKVWTDMGYIKNVILRRSDHAEPCEICDEEVGEGPDAERVVPLDYGNWPPFHPWCACDAQPEKPSAKSIAAFLKGDVGSPEVKTLMTSEEVPVTEIVVPTIIDHQQAVHEINAQKWYDEHVNIVSSDTAMKTVEGGSTYMQHMADQVEKTDDMIYDEYIAAAAANEQKILDNAEMKIGLSQEQLDGVLEDGRYKTQFETQTSGGQLDNQYRANAESSLFGLSYLVEETPLENRPVYGFMSDASIERTTYGKGQLNIVLNNDVRNRTTFTSADSFFYLYSGNVNETELGRGNGTPDSLTHVVGTTLPWGQYNALTATNVKELSDEEYVEIQVHGGVTLGDIKSIEICEPAIITRWPTIEAFMNEYFEYDAYNQFLPLQNTLQRAMDKGIKVTMGQISESALAYARLIKGGG